MIWVIERKECGYRPFQDGDWEPYSGTWLNSEGQARRQVNQLQESADEYTTYRVMPYARQS